MVDAALNINVLNHPAQHTIDGDAPTIGRAKNDPIVLVNIDAVEPLSGLIFEGIRTLLDHKPNFGLESILIRRLASQNDAALGFLRADINRHQHLIVEDLNRIKIAKLVAERGYRVRLVFHCHVRQVNPPFRFR